MAFDWKSLVSTVAPALAGTFGTPAAGLTVGALCQTFLGKPSGTDSELSQAMASASPDVLAKIKQTEADLQTKLAEIGMSLESLDQKDRDSARNMEINTKSRAPMILATIALASFFILVACLWIFGMPKDQALASVLTMVLGMMRDEVKSVYNFWFGTTASSDKQKDLLAKALDS